MFSYFYFFIININIRNSWFY